MFNGLQFPDNRLTTATLSRLEHNDPSLTSLDLTWIDIGVDELGMLNNALRDNTTLTSLNLCGNSIGLRRGGAEHLVELLRNKHLKSLNLDQNQLGLMEPSELSNMLLGNTSLTSLVLSANRLGPRHAKTLASLLEHNTTLTSLDLSMNDIGTEGAMLLITSLLHTHASCETLTSLDLSVNRLDPQVQQSLTKFLNDYRQAMHEGHHSLVDLHNDDETSLISTLPCDMCIVNDIIQFADANISNCHVIWTREDPFYVAVHPET